MPDRDPPTIPEIRAHARAIDEGLEHHQSRRRLWLVTKPYRFFSGDWNMQPMLVLARSAVEARKLVREKFYRERRDVPQELEAVEVDVTTSRVLDEYDEDVRARMILEERA